LGPFKSQEENKVLIMVPSGAVRNTAKYKFSKPTNMPSPTGLKFA